MGRPAKFKREDCDTAIDLMEKGFSKTAVASVLSINRNTLYSWCRRYDEFSDAIKVGELKSFGFWEKAGMLAIMGKLENFNSSVWIFTMKTRFHKILRQEMEQNEGFY